MTKVSSTNLSHIVGVELKGFYLKLFHKDVGYEGADGGSHRLHLGPVHNTYLGRGSKCW